MDVTGLGAVSELVTTVVNKFWPDKTEEEKAQIASALSVIQSQLEINKVEAANPSVFVSGWRPFVGWGCGFGLIYCSIVEPILRFSATVWFNYTGAFPVIDTTLTAQVLLGLLGLAGLRSFDKNNGVAAK